MNDDYDELAPVYDRLNPKDEIFKQKPFWGKLVRDRKIETVLDCACGNGWHLEMLDDLGLKVSGSDLSPVMISQAKNNLVDKNVDLKEGDYRYLPAIWNNHNFDMVTCLTTSLPYMLTDDDIVNALNSMYDVLNDGGILVIDNGISDSLLNDKPKLIPARIHDEDAFYFFMEYPKDRIVFNILYVKKTEDSFDHLFKTTTYNAMGREVLEKAFSKTKFSQVSYYGDYELSAYDENSGRLLVIAQK